MAILGSTAQNKSSWRAGMAALGLLLAGPASAIDLLQAYQGALEQDATVRAVRAGGRGVGGAGGRAPPPPLIPRSAQTKTETNWEKRRWMTSITRAATPH